MGIFGFGKKQNKNEFACPIKGRVEDLSNTPDEAFAGKMMGDGVVIFPEEGVVYAPSDIEVSFVFPTKHALGLRTEEGLELLIHVGIETVKLDGEGFNVFVKEGDKVKKGDKLMEFDLETITQKASSIATPVIVTNLSPKQSVEVLKQGSTLVGEQLFKVNQ